MDPMSISIFRGDLPEFANTNDYPDGMVTYWLNAANLMLRADRWGEALNLGLEQFIAHHIVMEKLGLDTAAVGGYPGLNKGVVSGESPGGVNLSYDTNSVIEVGAGHWNYTIYGTRFVYMMRMFGVGPIQVGAGMDGSCDGGLPWAGPISGQGPFF
jgi:hypothetical protein